MEPKLKLEQPCFYFVIALKTNKLKIFSGFRI